VTRRDRLMIWLSWKLPRDLVAYCYARVAVASLAPNQSPTDQTVVDPLRRWHDETARLT
jgi:hypothetical protein